MNSWLDSLGLFSTGAISLETALYSLVVAFLAGQLISWCYVRTHAGLSYSRNFAQSLILLCLIVTLVVLVVGSSIMVAFGLLVAISMIRFRTPVRDSRDTAFLFLSLATGMAIGTQYAILAVVGSGLVCAVAAYLHFTGFGSRFGSTALLQLQGARMQVESSGVQDALRRFCKRVRLLSLNPIIAGAEEADAVFDYAYELELRDPEHAGRMLETLSSHGRLSGVNLIMHEQRDEV